MSSLWTMVLLVQGFGPGNGVRVPTVEIKPGVHMPMIGLGAAHFQGATIDTVANWINIGGRAIDTSEDYGYPLGTAQKATGVAIATAIAAGKVTRGDLFVTSKVPQTELGYQSALDSANRSLHELKLDYLDLLLIYWPGVYNQPTADPTQSRQDTWRALEHLLKAGKVKAIGVSNFMPKHLKEIFEITTTGAPAVNQFELHAGVFHLDTEVLAVCKEHNITVTGYAPLAKGALLSEPTLQKVAAAHNKSTAQVALKWLVQQNATTIPGADTVPYMEEDLAVFGWELSPSEVAALNGMTAPGRIYNDPNNIP